MPHWTDRFIDIPYSPDGSDCADLVCRVAREYLGIEPRLPQHAQGLRAQAEQITRLRYEYVNRVGAPVDGHPVLFIVRGKFFHLGCAAVICGETWILHNASAVAKSVCQPLRDLTTWQFVLEGFYKWR